LETADRTRSEQRPTGHGTGAGVRVGVGLGLAVGLLGEAVEPVLCALGPFAALLWSVAQVDHPVVLEDDAEHRVGVPTGRRHRRPRQYQPPLVGGDEYGVVALEPVEHRRRPGHGTAGRRKHGDHQQHGHQCGQRSHGGGGPVSLLERRDE
jgi:hypothetical protein